LETPLQSSQFFIPPDELEQGVLRLKQSLDKME